MEKILVNSTAFPVEVKDMGITVQVGISFTINPQEYAMFASSINLTILISNGTLIVNDSIENLSIEEGLAYIRGLSAKAIRFDNSSNDFSAKNLQEAVIEAKVGFDTNKMLTGYEFEVLVDQDGNILIGV